MYGLRPLRIVNEIACLRYKAERMKDANADFYGELDFNSSRRCVTSSLLVLKHLCF